MGVTKSWTWLSDWTATRNKGSWKYYIVENHHAFAHTISPTWNALSHPLPACLSVWTQHRITSLEVIPDHQSPASDFIFWENLFSKNSDNIRNTYQTGGNCHFTSPLPAWTVSSYPLRTQNSMSPSWKRGTRANGTSLSISPMARWDWICPKLLSLRINGLEYNLQEKWQNKYLGIKK